MASIKEIAKEFDLSQDTLRYYERIGLIPPVHRTSGGIRDYQESDCQWIEFIKCMRGAGLSIEALIEYVTLFQKGDESLAARKKILLEQRDLLAERLEEMQQTLQRLNKKIKNYDNKIAECERGLKVSDMKGED